MAALPGATSKLLEASSTLIPLAFPLMERDKSFGKRVFSDTTLPEASVIIHAPAIVPLPPIAVNRSGVAVNE